jgi:hypothetical protein
MVILLYPALKSFVIFTEFQWNRAAISDRFCENIELNKNCQGTCHLVKEIKKEQSREKENPFTNTDKTKIEWFFIGNFSTKYHPFFTAKGSFYQNPIFKTDPHLCGVFHPPQSILFC